MSYLVDTNALLRLRDSADPRYHESISAIELLRAQNKRLFVCAQILAEFWVVLTRPCDVNGYGLSLEEAVTATAKVRAAFHCLAEPPDMADRWQQVVVDGRAMGRQAHDARIATIMLAHGIRFILTLNPGDFARYQGITPVTPQELVNQQAT